MTLSEAEKVASIIATADGGCSTCVEDLCIRLNRHFPEFVWTSEKNKTLDVVVKVSLIVDGTAGADVINYMQETIRRLAKTLEMVAERLDDTSEIIEEHGSCTNAGYFRATARRCREAIPIEFKALASSQ